MTLLDLIKQRRAVCDAATPGPWVAHVDDFEGHPDPAAARIDIMAGVNDDRRRCAVCEPEHSLDGGYDSQPKHNGAFIAASRNERPGELDALAIAVEALETIKSGFHGPDAGEVADEALAAIRAKVETEHAG